MRIWELGRSEDLGQLIKVRVRHDSSGSHPGWCLGSIKLERESRAARGAMGEAYTFGNNIWLDNSRGDKSTVRELPAVPTDGTELTGDPPQSVCYQIAVYTGDTHGACVTCFTADCERLCRF